MTYQYIDTENNDRTLLILHGLAGTKEVMAKHTRRLHENFRCIYPDLPGHNGVPLNNVQNIGDFTEYIRSFIDHMKLDRFGILGYSFGGNIATRLYTELSKDKSDLPVCVWASPVYGSVKVTPRLFLTIGGLLPYQRLDSNFLVRLTNIAGVRFDFEDIEGMKKTYKELLRNGLQLLEYSPENSRDSNIYKVYDPLDPFVAPINAVKYDRMIERCGHSGKRESVDLALEDISSFFNATL